MDPLKKAMLRAERDRGPPSEPPAVSPPAAPAFAPRFEVDTSPLANQDADPSVAPAEQPARHAPPEGLAAQPDPGAATETFRGLSERVVSQLRGLENQSVLVTSARPGEGKTFTAAGLAESLEQGGAEAVLVDGHQAAPVLDELRSRRPSAIFIVDGPSLLEGLEARRLAAAVGTVLLVVAAGRTREAELADAVNVLGRRVPMGIVYNGAPA